LKEPDETVRDNLEGRDAVSKNEAESSSHRHPKKQLFCNAHSAIFPIAVGRIEIL
jgi:hypothetical protein